MEHVVGIVQGPLLAALAVLGVVLGVVAFAVVVAVSAAPAEHAGHPAAHGVLLRFKLTVAAVGQLVEVEKGLVVAAADVGLDLLVALGHRHGGRHGGIPPPRSGRCRRRRRPRPRRR